MQKFLTDTLTGRYIKALLYNSYIPSYRTIKENDFIVSGVRYAYKEFIIEATSTGYIDPYDEHEQNPATYKIIDLYSFGQKNIKYTYNYISKTNYYDSETHIHLGNYLRTLRDLKGVDLMPFYNCYCDKYDSNFIVSTSGVQLYTKKNIRYETIQIPIRFNQTYTIAIDSPSEVTMCPVLFSHEDLIVIDSVDISKFLWDKPGNIVRYSSLQFSYPVTYTLHNDDAFLQKYEKNLYLFIQVPYGLNSSIVILEGDYTSTARKIIGMESIQEMSNLELNEYLLSPLSLLKLNDRVRYAFSDRLVEYLYNNPIDINEDINQNIERVQTAIQAHKYFDVYKDIWQNELRGLIYNSYLDNNDTYYDINGYIDKDIEKFLVNPIKASVSKKIILSIEADTSKMKTNYATGTRLDLSGIKIIAHYTTGESEDVTSKCTFDPVNGTILDSTIPTPISVTYVESRRTRTTEFYVNVTYGSIKFYSSNSFTLATSNSEKNWDGEIEYSTNNDTWSSWDGSTISSASSDTSNILYVRGISNISVTGVGEDAANYGNGFVLTGSNISCEGEIASLLDYKKVINNDIDSITVGQRAFEKLFYNNTELMRAPRHSLNTLAEYCYSSMYEGCSKLQHWPYLPVTTLFTGCYERMFYGCSKLTTAANNANSLPASIIPPFAYKQMFSNCFLLKKISVRSISQLSEGSCESMFAGCTLLKVTDTIDRVDYASTIFDFKGDEFPPDSVKNMFANTGGRWQGTPELHKTYFANTNSESIEFYSDYPFTIQISSRLWDGTLQYSSYPNDGYKTWNGNQISANRLDGKYRLYLRGFMNTKLSNSSTSGVFSINGSNVHCSGNIESLLDYESLENGYSIFMANYGFRLLFANQTALVSVPRFMRTQIPNYGYYQMFSGCSNIKISATADETYRYPFRIPAQRNGSAGTSALTGMFTGTGGTFTGTAAVNVQYYTDNPII